MAKSLKPISEYDKLVKSGIGRKSRKKLSVEEQAHRNRVRQEARRRALLVLQHRYSEEYAALYQAEQEFLNQEESK
jgi:hypothetical protein